MPVEYTLIKFQRCNKVNFATLTFCATLAQIKRDVKEVEQVYLGEIPRMLELNPVDACQGFPTELTP